ncbi:MAG: 30S ribosomal protein S20 [Opitutales bacterium]
MANTKASKKDIRRITRRTAHNLGIKTRLKTLRKKALFADDASAEEKQTQVNEYAAALDKAAKTGLIHPNKANRQKSRAAKRLNKAKAPAS